MSIIRFLFVALVAFMLTCACGNVVSPEKIYTPDITIKEVNGKRYAYYQGKLFSGEVYSSDEKAKMIVKNGLAAMVQGRLSSENDEPFGWTMEDDIAIVKLNNHDYNTQGELLSLSLQVGFINDLPQCDFINSYR